MNQKLRYLLFFIGIVFSSLEGKGQYIFGETEVDLAIDDASNYNPPNWEENSNEGEGFLGWTFDTGTPNDGFAGNFIGSFSPEIETNGKVFALFANSGNDAFSGATRQFPKVLHRTDQFSVKVAMNFRDGAKGFDLRDSDNNSIINFNVGDDEYRLDETIVLFGNEYDANTVFEFTFTQNENTLDWEVVRTGGQSGTQTGTINDIDSGTINNIRFYNVSAGTNNDGGSGQRNLFFNDLKFISKYTIPSTESITLSATDTSESTPYVWVQEGGNLTFGTQLLQIEDTGIVNNLGTLNDTFGTLEFLSTGSISGEVALHNLEINGEVNAGNTTTVANETKIKAGGFFSTNAPRFLENSILVYDTGGNYARGIEWNNDDTSTSGTPHHVKIESGTTLFMQSTSNFTSDATILGDLIIDGGTFNMNNFTHSDVTVNDIKIINAGALTVGNTTSGDPVEGRSIIAQGDFFNTNGSVTLGDGFQGDLKVRGSQLVYLTDDSTFNSQGRAIVFDGNQNISITSTGEIKIDFMVIDMPSGEVTVSKNLHISGENGIGDQGILLQMDNNATLNLNGFDLKLGSGDTNDYDVTMDEDAKVISTPTTIIEVLNNGDTQLRLDTTNDEVTNAVQKLIVNNSGTTEILNPLHIFESLEVDGATVDGNGNLIFKSNADKTAVIAEVKNGGEVVGNIRVERFFPMGNRAFRYVSSPVSSTENIRTNWQEGQNNTGTNLPNDNQNSASGFGTHITGSSTGANGFDATLSGNPSMFTWDNDVPDPIWDSIPNTDATNLEAGKAYALMMRGDRSANLNDNEATGNSTTLRAQGTPLYGTQEITTGVDIGNFAFIGNPYQAQIDLTKVTKSNFGNFFYIWDPTIGEIGGYAAVEIDAVGYQGTTPSSGTEANQFLQVGQAFFIQATDNSPSITFQESYKSENTDNLATFSVPNHATVNINLLRNENLLVDGLRISLADAFDDEVNFSDATKLWSQQEHFAIDKNPHWLMVEKRSIPENESILFYLDNYFSSNYQFNINIQQLATHKIFLHDAYLEESFELNNNGENTYSFEVDSNIQASKGPNRFSLYFEEISLATETLEVETLVVYPNPTSETVNIQLPQSTNGEEIHLSIRDLLGKTVLQKKVKQTETQLQLKFPKNVPSGTYLLKAQTKEKQFSTKLIKK